MSIKITNGTSILDPLPGSALLDASVVKSIKQIWLRQVKVVTPTPPAGSEEYEWVLHKSLIAPPTTVPGVTITGPGAFSIGPTETGNVTVAWTTTSSPWESTFSVRVRWYVNGTYSDQQVVLQSVGAATHAFYGGTDVYGVVSYVNEQGDGPTVTTSTVHIGI